MKCSECSKELNEMTLYCDRCGAQLSDSKTPLTFETIESGLVPLQIDSNFSVDHKEDIKLAYFLSHIRKDFRGFKKSYIDQYIDYVLLRTYYEKNKVLLTTKEFDKEKALHLLQAFSERRLNAATEIMLLEEYGDDYENKIIPKHITDQVPNIYNVKFNAHILSPNKYLPKTLFHIVKGAISSLLFLGIIGVIAYFVIGVVLNIDLLNLMMDQPFSFIVLGVVVILLGFLKSRKQKKYYPFEDAISRNSTFKKHIKTDIKERIKTLRYRIKKDGKLNKKLGR